MKFLVDANVLSEGTRPDPDGRVLEWLRKHQAETGLRWARLLADLRLAGCAMPVKDSLIAASALVHGLTVVTRNAADFQSAGVLVLNAFHGE